MSETTDLLKRMGYDTSGLDQTDGTENTDTPSGIQVLDGDTVVAPDGTHIRMAGIGTEESAKFFPNKIKDYQEGSLLQKKLLHDTIVAGGFNRPVISGKKDVHDRAVGDLLDADGRSANQTMLNNGWAMPTEFTTAEETEQAGWAEMERTRRKIEGKATDSDKLADQLMGQMFPGGQVLSKVYSPSAKAYGSSLDEQGHSDFYAGPAVVNGDEMRNGYAKSNLKTGIKAALTSTQQAFYDATAAIGQMTGSDYLRNTYQGDADALQKDIEDMPWLQDSEALDEEGNLKLHSVSQVGNYLLNTITGSTPQFAISIAAGLAAPFTFGASLAVPALMYSGMAYRGQEGEKSPYWAFSSGIAQAAVEQLGLVGFAGNIFAKDVQGAVIKRLMTEKMMSKPMAEKALAAAIKKPVGEVAEWVKAARGGIVERAARRGLEGIASEAPEEMVQEIAQYWGEQKGITLPSDPEDMMKLKNRILNAGIGGAALGGTLHIASGAVKDMSPQSGYDSTDREFREDLMRRNKGLVPDVLSVMKDMGTPDEGLELRANQRDADVATQGLPARIGNWWAEKGPKSLYQAFSKTIMGTNNYNGDRLAMLGTLLGTNRAFRGGSIEEQQAQASMEIANKFGTEDSLRKAFGGKTLSQISMIFQDASVVKYINELVNTRQSTLSGSIHDIAGQVDPASHLSKDMMPMAQVILNTAAKIDDTVTAFNKKSGFTYTVDDLLVKKPLDKTVISRNQGEFIAKLKEAFKVSHSEALDITNRILHNEGVDSVEDVFDDMLNIGSDYTQLKTRVEKMLSDPATNGKFARYFSHDLYNNISSLASKGGSAFANSKLIGKNGSKLNGLLSGAVADGAISEHDAGFMAKELRDWLDMRSGKYHEIKSPYVTGALGFVNFFTTVTSLPLAAISSTVEFAQVYRNLSTGQSIKATMHLLKGAGAEIGHVFKAMGNKPDDSEYRTTLHKHGFMHEGNMSKRVDVVAGYFAKWNEGFFKLTGLTSVTNITRYAKLSIASDAVQNWTQNYMADPASPKGQQAYEHLTRLGVNVETLVDDTAPSASAQAMQRYNDEISRAVHAFVLEAVVQPTKLNRPKFYSDPYLQVFTQFQGYISAFTATVLPRLLKDLRRTGTQEQVNAASVIALMFAIAMLSMYLKDMIKYGESPPKWLKEEKSFQRMIGQVGILGTGQRVWDGLSPVIPNKSNQSNVALSAFRALTDEAPALSFLGKVNDAISAPEGSRIKRTAKILPIFGTSTQFADYLQKELGG